MKIIVERCSGGNFRLTLPNGGREFIQNPEGDWWNRKNATEAKTMLCALHGFRRSSIRFYHLN